MADLSAPLIFPGSPDACEIRLLSALVMKAVLGDLAGEYARATGHTLAVSLGAAGAVADRIREGEDCDVAIVQKRVLDALAQQGKIAEGSIVTLARSGIALAVRKGMAMPVIDTVEALKKSLLAARSVAYDDPEMGHASGVHFRGIIERLGIAQAIGSKAKLMKHAVAEFAARDEAEIVVTQPMEILAAPDYELVGWLPPELQDEDGFTWAAGMGAHAGDPDAAKALIRFLSSPEAASVFETRGMLPVAR